MPVMTSEGGSFGDSVDAVLRESQVFETLPDRTLGVLVVAPLRPEKLSGTFPS
jgi:hypothetical protein